MKKERLNQLRYLVIETKYIREKLENREHAIKTYGDTTGDYKTGRKRIITITGEADPTADKYIQRMAEKAAKIDAEIIHMEDWMEQIESSRSRTVLRMYYQEGLTQSEIGEKLSIERSLVSKIIADAVE